MFRLFSESNDIPVAEIKNGQHLDRAKATKAKAFFSSFLYQSSPDLWAAFYVDEQYVYWGKPQKKQLTPSLFNKTAISEIQSKIVKHDSSKKDGLKERAAAWLYKKYDLLDGARYQTAFEEKFSLEFDNLNLHLLIPSELNITPVVPNPETRKYQTVFKAIFDLNTLELLKVEELPTQS
ncbi:MAG: hypothetical protein GY810_03915 [Aureispira sp.]|nr:hypothetical protein [Aureispira sp.]